MGQRTPARVNFAFAAGTALPTRSNHQTKPSAAALLLGRSMGEM